MSKKQALFNSLLVQVLFAKDDYDDGKINIDTLNYIFKNVYYLVLIHFPEKKYSKEWDSHAGISAIRKLLIEI